MTVSTPLSASPLTPNSDVAYESLQPEEALIFLHIMKTAGTTLFKIVEQQYPEDSIFHYVPMRAGKRLDDLNQWPQEQRDRLRFFHGHGCYGTHESLNKPSRYITMLRHPVKRVVSLYYFIHHNPKRSTPPEGHCPTLTSYMDAGLFAVDNAQTRAIAGKAAADFPYGECTAELLDIAKQNLAQFLAVGTTERFDESLLVFRYVLGLDNILYARTNENTRKPKIEDIDPKEIALVKSFNQLDEELYLYANQLLDEKIQQIGEQFPIEFQFFQYVNRQYRDVELELKATKKILRDKHQRLNAMREQRDYWKNERHNGPSIRERVTHKVKGLGRRLLGREN